MCYSSKLLVAWEHQRINIIVSYTLAIAQTCRTGKKGCEWHVCDTLWCLAGQWRGNSRFFFLFSFILWNFFWSSLLNLNIGLSVEKTMGKLATVLDGYENVEVVPSLFIFMGNFCSHPCNLSFHSFSSLRWGPLSTLLFYIIIFFIIKKFVLGWVKAVTSKLRM